MESGQKEEQSNKVYTCDWQKVWKVAERRAIKISAFSYTIKNDQNCFATQKGIIFW